MLLLLLFVVDIKFFSLFYLLLMFNEVLAELLVFYYLAKELFITLFLEGGSSLLILLPINFYYNY